MEVRCCYRSVYVNSFRQAQFQAYALSRSNYHHGFVNVLFRNISLILKTVFNIKASHTTVSNWCVKFAPMFDDMRIQLVSLLDLNSDEWHADETVVKIAGVKHYIWFIIDSETRFVIGFHLFPHRDSPQAVSLFSEAVKLGKPSAIVSDRYSAYKVPVKSILTVLSTFAFKALKTTFQTI